MTGFDREPIQENKYNKNGDPVAVGNRQTNAEYRFIYATSEYL
jgi:hypothetical protein